MVVVVVVAHENEIFGGDKEERGGRKYWEIKKNAIAGSQGEQCPYARPEIEEKKKPVSPPVYR